MSINIVWFKRDLRLSDHEPFQKAIASGLPTVLLAFLEPSLMQAPPSDNRHWRFVYQSIADMNGQLANYGSQVNIVYGEVIQTLSAIAKSHRINTIYSYQETGLDITYTRDKKVADFCNQHNIKWDESQYAGVIRGLSDRKNWSKQWYETMSKPLAQPDLSKLKSVSIGDLSDKNIPEDLKQNNKDFQPGGPTSALRYLHSFLQTRSANYNKNISKPLASRKSCSRLSPYLAWGNLSMREVYQAMQTAKSTSNNKRNLASFASRLRWHCHFIQKFEMEMRYESENINRGYDQIRTETDEGKLAAWKNGQTGYPLVDACMRCVKATGYINFRMRAMVVSFFTHHLWQHWKEGADYLAKQFLDFEPGIHYPQFQMQAGTTGINTIRIYNPVKQAKDNDPEGEFIKQWVPELADLPINFLIEPWLMTDAEQQMYGVKLGQVYPAPIVDIKATYKQASSTLWKMKGNADVKKEAKGILKKHTVANRRV